MEMGNVLLLTGGNFKFYCLQPIKILGRAKFSVFFPVGNKSSVYFSNGDEISGYFSYRGRFFGQYFQWVEAPNYIIKVRWVNMDSAIFNRSILILGTRWTQEIVWCLKNNMNLEKALSTNLNVRVPMLWYVRLKTLRS